MRRLFSSFLVRNRREVNPLHINIRLATHRATLIVFHPSEDASRVELMSTVEHILLPCFLYFHETNRTLEDLLVEDWLLPVIFPYGVYHVFVTIAASAPRIAAKDHTYYSSLALAIEALDILCNLLFMDYTTSRFFFLAVLALKFQP
jgi:hypothetical protein